MKIKNSIIWLFPVLFAFLLTACNKQAQQIKLEGKTMGTTYHVTYINDGRLDNFPEPQQIQQQVDTLLREVNNQMSTYQNDSQISQFNQFKQTEAPFAVAKDFALVVKEAIRLHSLTGGALDITIGPMVNLWGFGPDKRLNKVPTAEQISERIKSIGIEKLEVEQAGQQTYLIKHHPDLYIDLSSIAKGFGVDKVAQYLESLGLANYLVEIGGELRGKGKNLKGKLWQIAVEKPTFAQGQAIQLVVPLDNKGFATSGNYRNYFEDEQGNRLSHIIDPQQMQPIKHNLASITVIADSSMTADGLSTGLFVLGPEKALEIAEREKLAVFLILKNGQEYETKMSSEFKKLTE